MLENAFIELALKQRMFVMRLRCRRACVLEMKVVHPDRFPLKFLSPHWLRSIFHVNHKYHKTPPRPLLQAGLDNFVDSMKQNHVIPHPSFSLGVVEARELGNL